MSAVVWHSAEPPLLDVVDGDYVSNTSIIGLEVNIERCLFGSVA